MCVFLICSTEINFRVFCGSIWEGAIGLPQCPRRLLTDWTDKAILYHPFVFEGKQPMADMFLEFVASYRRRLVSDNLTPTDEVFDRSVVWAARDQLRGAPRGDEEFAKNLQQKCDWDFMVTLQGHEDAEAARAYEAKLAPDVGVADPEDADVPPDDADIPPEDADDAPDDDAVVSGEVVDAPEDDDAVVSGEVIPNDDDGELQFQYDDEKEAVVAQRGTVPDTMDTLELVRHANKAGREQYQILLKRRQQMMTDAEEAAKKVAEADGVEQQQHTELDSNMARLYFQAAMALDMSTSREVRHQASTAWSKFAELLGRDDARLLHTPRAIEARELGGKDKRMMAHVGRRILNL